MWVLLRHKVLACFQMDLFLVTTGWIFSKNSIIQSYKKIIRQIMTWPVPHTHYRFCRSTWNDKIDSIWRKYICNQQGKNESARCLCVMVGSTMTSPTIVWFGYKYLDTWVILSHHTKMNVYRGKVPRRQGNTLVCERKVERLRRNVYIKRVGVKDTSPKRLQRVLVGRSYNSSRSMTTIKMRVGFDRDCCMY